MTTESPTRRRVWPWVLVALLLVVAGIWALFTFSDTDEVTEELSFPAEVDALVVNTEGGSIDIRTEARDDIAVVVTRRAGLWADATAETAAEDGSLLLEGDCDAFPLSTCTVSFSVRVPEGREYAVQATATAGTMELSGISGPLTASTTAGEITVTEHFGQDVRLQTTAGGVDFTSVEPPTQLIIETTAGGITVRVPDVGYRIATETTVGDVEISLDEESDADRSIQLATTVGGIDLGSS